MKQKKLVHIFLIVSLLCISTLPILNLFFMYQHGTLTAKNMTTKELFATDKTETNINYFTYRTLHLSLNFRKTIVGKDGFLFLGNKYAAILDKAQGLYPYKIEDIDQWTDKLKAIQTWYEEKGIQFIFAIAPNKSSIYPEKLPDSIIYKQGGTITDDILTYAMKKNIKVLDLRGVLQKKKGKDWLYFKTDTHWNNKGASIGYEATIHFLNNKYKEQYILPKHILNKTRQGSGDLADFLKIREKLSPEYEENFAFVFNAPVKVCLGNINIEELATEVCKITGNPILYISVQDQYVTSKNAANPEKLLFIGDSFSTANSKPYNATFGTLWKFHHSRLYGKKLADFVEKNQPDIVIYQIAERDLYTQTLVEPLL